MTKPQKNRDVQLAGIIIMSVCVTIGVVRWLLSLI